MLTPDPHVAFPLYGQSWNRYSYVHNSPLNFSDPTGFQGEGDPPPPQPDPPPDDHTKGPGGQSGGGCAHCGGNGKGGYKELPSPPPLPPPDLANGSFISAVPQSGPDYYAEPADVFDVGEYMSKAYKRAYEAQEIKAYEEWVRKPTILEQIARAVERGLERCDESYCSSDPLESAAAGFFVRSLPGMIGPIPEGALSSGVGASLKLVKGAAATPEEAAITFAAYVEQAQQFLHQNPDLIPIITRAGAAEIGYAPRAVAGKAMHEVLAGVIESGPHAGEIIYIGGRSPFDFEGKGRFAGYIFELATGTGAESHGLRVSLQQPGAFILTYDITKLFPK